MATPAEPPSHRDPRGQSGRVAAVGLLLVIAPLTIEPLLRGLWRAVGGSSPDLAADSLASPTAAAPHHWFATLTIPALIAVLATVAAWPTAWWLRSLAPARRRAVLALFVVPLLMPMYLAFSGWSMAIKGPGTPIGIWLSQWPDVSIFAGKALAVISLVAWCWPVATLALLPATTAVPASEIDALRGAGASTAMLHRVLLNRTRTGVLLAIALCTLLMLGSVVPLHLAQINTLAISLWAELALRPESSQAWRMSLPLVVAAIAGSILLTRHLAATITASSPGSDALRASPLSTLLVAGVWLIAVVVPITCFAWAITSWPAAAMVWREALPSLLGSLAVGLIVGVGLVVLAIVSCRAAQSPGWPALAARVAFTLAAITAILPGVLIGSAQPGKLLADLISEPSLPLALGHLSRFGVLGIGAGLLIAALEPAALRDTRSSLAGDALRPWLRTLILPAWPTLTGLVFAGLALSLHEIEATIQLRPPGTRPLAQLMLDNLHMNSLQELASLGVLTLLGSLICAAVAAVLLARGRSD